MRRLDRIWLSVFSWILVLAVLNIPSAANAQTWNATVGAETKNEAKQADAFLPNELWIYAGDSITWKFAPQNEIHTVTFLTPGQVRPPFPVGCPGTTTSGPNNTFDGSTCVNSGPMAGGALYTVAFPTAGNYKLVCLVHADMNGTVHVLPHTASLPHHQGFYDDEARDEARSILSDTDREGDDDDDRGDWHSNRDSENTVITTGEVRATGAGRQYLSIVRFLPETIRIHVGETVEWTNIDPTEPHTVTFGTEPLNVMPPSQNVTKDADGTLLATINSTSDSVNSGFLQAAPQDRIGLSQSDPGTTRIRIKFTQAGIYNYICALHDVDGMKGTVIVK
jgi:plastocyanin